MPDARCLGRIKIDVKKLILVSAWVAWTAFVGWAVTICFLSSLSGEELQVMPSSLLQWDKPVHAIAFGIGGLILGVALHRTTKLRGRALTWAIVGGIALCGALDELHQLTTPGRSGADFYDWVADVIGGSIAAFLYTRWHGKKDTAEPASAGSSRDDPTPAPGDRSA